MTNTRQGGATRRELRPNLRAEGRGAIQTDLILSAEIMAITLSTVAEATSSFWTQAIVLAVVGSASP